jgi:hypothetical protein
MMNGVGRTFPVPAQSLRSGYLVTIDDPRRFKRSRSVGAYFLA